MAGRTLVGPLRLWKDTVKSSKLGRGGLQALISAEPSKLEPGQVEVALPPWPHRRV
jgi:hypothetical protein